MDPTRHAGPTFPTTPTRTKTLARPASTFPSELQTAAAMSSPLTPMAGDAPSRSSSPIPFHIPSTSQRQGLKSSLRRPNTQSVASSESRAERVQVMFEPDTRADETGFDSTDESGFESTDSSEHDAGGADGEYVEKSRVVLPNKNIAKNVEAPSGQTPRKRRKTTSSINTGVKLRVVALDPYGGICLLTGALKPRKSRQFCHIVARRTSAEVLTMLEWWWQLAYWTLYIDTRYNILILMANWHLAMDGHEWTFVPHHQLITNVLVWARAVIEQDPTGYNKDARTPISESYGHQTNFLYYMLPLDEDMEEVVIHRYPAPVEGAAFDPTAIIPHLHPFTTIGPLTSHMHPHFVIFSAGQKLTDLRANVPLHERAKFMEGLAAIASFGHTGDAAEIKLHNLDTLTALLDIYALWSSTEHVPQAKSGHQWRKHPKAPEE